jgi:alcohol dehydrogenase (cytochrome c)
MSTDSGITFTGDAVGNFLALDTSDGKTQWHAGTGGHIDSSPITYELDGRQIVLVSSDGVMFAWALPESGERGKTTAVK